MTTQLTPMMQQWQSCKTQAQGALLLFRLGDFYEAFFEDAECISRLLDLTLTKRQEIPMAGIPFHTCDTYIDRLVAKGYRVAVAEQIGDPKAGKGLVERKIVRVVTPGAIVQSSLLTDKESNYLAALYKTDTNYGLGIVDVTTAELRALEFGSSKELLDALVRWRPKELLFPDNWQEPALLDQLVLLIHPSLQQLSHTHFSPAARFDLPDLLGRPIGALLHYLESLHLSTEHLHTLHCFGEKDTMQLDRATQRNLELIQPLREGQKESTLLYLLDETKTAMGGRLLRKWITHPLLSLPAIEARQEAIQLLFSHFGSLLTLRRHLDGVRDLERLSTRIEMRCASPRDLAALRRSLEELPPFATLLRSLSLPPLLQTLLGQLGDPAPILELIGSALQEDPPLRVSDGGVFKAGYHAELDTLRALKSDSTQWLAHYQTSLRQETGIKTLKVGYTQAFGYYIEVSRGALDRIPSQFQRKQTLVNGERYITPELKNFEQQILTADEKVRALEQTLFQELCTALCAYCALLRQTAGALAQLDCLISLAKVAKERGYCRPQIEENGLFQVVEGRHPVIEMHLKEPFIPNAIDLSHQKQLALITGPNMAGKSTYIRQCALIAILAQIGSFIPAKSARIGLIDKVFCRIGASDDLASGQSTFMVEMTETAHILQSATNRSLVILDEIGRGTSTYDGISIAWAVADYLLTTPGKKAKTLFATHYWEMTELATKHPNAFNLTVTVEETNEGILFLHKIKEGAADKSYGIHVARLAGLPAAALQKAEEKLIQLESSDPPLRKPMQLDLFSSPTPRQERAEKFLAILDQLDPNRLTPIEALQLLARWKQEG